MKKFHICFLFILFIAAYGLACQGGRQAETPANSSGNTTQNAKPQPSESKTPASESTATGSAKQENAPPKESPKNSSEPQDKVETRCGWFSNPTPGNAWLNDKDGEWTIGIQGGYQAEGDWPDFPDDKWVKTNVNYGYGCACMRVKVNFKDKRILEILSSTVKPLSDCRKDKALNAPTE